LKLSLFQPASIEPSLIKVEKGCSFIYYYFKLQGRPGTENLLQGGMTIFGNNLEKEPLQ